ncbi:RluA family pseudouridine synthase [Aminivibrio pyruvatiphilus]|uniref:Pseudouridine synthase n=2 Tax=Aminivibrio pyruvatiphilus TaxID=1005740 RepID=A0A4R8M5A1_9BACT|nr:RluA family pseudouridine synthase [Aminivibrio pyruvatiphilus]
MKTGSARGVRRFSPPEPAGRSFFMMQDRSSPAGFSSLDDEDDGGGPENSGTEMEFLAAGEEDRGVRLDVFLSSRLGITRTFARKLVEEGNVRLLPEKKAKPGMKMVPGIRAEVTVPPPEALDLEPEEVPFGVVYEDDWLIVIDKPSGVVVHPAPGNRHGTLVHGLLHRFRSFGSFNNVLRPGIVHRLDASTSGLLVVAREQEILENLQNQFRLREVRKLYLALVHGRVKNASGRIEAPIGRSPSNRLRMAVVEDGKHAITDFRRLWVRDGYSFLECSIATGRTHQIRVHLSSMGHPIVGDVLYGADKKKAASAGRVFLHSWKLSFLHPKTGNRLFFRSCLPAALTGQLREILSTCPD